MKLSTTIEEWKEILGDCELHQINVIYECRDFDYWGRQNDPEYESEENEQPTEFDIDRRGWEIDKSAEYIISALMDFDPRGRDWPLFCSVFNSVFRNQHGRLIEFADGFSNGYHKITMMIQTDAPHEVVKRIQAVDTRLVVEIEND
ncbi:MAG: hypothetical protein CMA60_05855 [Euryarchaeota archaeon]|nr:hypothetical protein [Euryarchaeota archaeon]